MSRAIIVFIAIVAFLSVVMTTQLEFSDLSDEVAGRVSSVQKKGEEPKLKYESEETFEEREGVKRSPSVADFEDENGSSNTRMPIARVRKPPEPKLDTEIDEESAAKLEEEAHGSKSQALLKSLRVKETPFGGNSLSFFISQKMRRALLGKELSRDQTKKVRDRLMAHFKKAAEINLLAIDPNEPPSVVLEKYSLLYEETVNELRLEMDYETADSLLNRGESSYDEGVRRLRNSMGNITNFSGEQNQAMERAIHRVMLDHPEIAFTSRGHQGGLSVHPLSTEEDIEKSREYLSGLSSYSELAKKSYDTISEGKNSLLIALKEEGVFEEAYINKLEKDFKFQSQYLNSLAKRIEREER